MYLSVDWSAFSKVFQLKLKNPLATTGSVADEKQRAAGFNLTWILPADLFFSCHIQFDSN